MQEALTRSRRARVHLHRRLRPRRRPACSTGGGRRRIGSWPAILPDAVSQDPDRGGPHLRHRRFGLDLGRHDGRRRSGAGDGGEGPTAPTWRVRSRTKLVVYHRRAGGQSQIPSTSGDGAEVGPDPERSRPMRKRNLARRCRSNSWPKPRISARGSSAAPSARRPGQSPAKAVENLRVEAARLMMEEGRHSDRRGGAGNRLCRPRTHAPRLSTGFRATAADDPAECAARRVRLS